MRINKDRVEKFQAGGGFMSFQPLPMVPTQQQQPMQAAAPTGAEDNGGRILDDDTFKALLGKGVTNDVMQYSAQLQQAEREYGRMSDIERNTSRGLRLRATLKGDIGTITGLMRAREQFDKARDSATVNESMGDLAVTNRGMLVKDMTTGRLQEVGYDDYAKDMRAGESRKYQALTNAQLLAERENNPSLVGDTQTLTALSNSVGMTKVKDEIYKALTSISSNSEKQTGNEYLDVQNEKMAAGVASLIGNAQQGVYDINSMESETDNKQQVAMAMRGLWDNLSGSAKSLLRARAVQDGVQGDDIEKLAKQNAIELLAPKESVQHEKSLVSTYNHDMTLDKRGMGGLAPIGANEALISKDAVHVPIQLNVGNNQKFTTFGAQIPGFFNQGKPVGQTSITNIDIVRGIGDMNSVYFGDQKVDKSKLDSVIYDGGKVVTVPIPYTTGPNGEIKPDLDLFSRLSKAKQELATIPIQAQSRTVKETIYHKNDIPTNEKGDDSVPQKNFLMFNATGNETTINGNKSDLITNLSQGPNKKDAEYNYKQTYVYGGKDPKSENDRQRPEYKSHIFKPNSWVDPDVIQSMVFIHVIDDNQGARLLDGNSPSVNKFTTTTDFYHNVNMQNVDPNNLEERAPQTVPAYDINALANYKRQ